MITTSEMEQALHDAKADLARADNIALSLAEMLVGRLRKVSGYNARRVLVQLKRELQDFDAGRKLWKEEK